MPDKSRIIAVDFDGTICSNRFPEIGYPNWELISHLKECKANGDKLVLWTMREGEDLTRAVNACKVWGLDFDEVNDNITEIKEAFRANPRKVFANIYVDDHNAMGNNVFTKLPYESYDRVITDAEM